jgi:hypothetical protein
MPRASFGWSRKSSALESLASSDARTRNRLDFGYDPARPKDLDPVPVAESAPGGSRQPTEEEPCQSVQAMRRLKPN